MKNVEGKLAFVTGGASGLGLAMTRSFAAAGMRVIAADIEQSALDALGDEFSESNAQVTPMRVDVTAREQMQHAAEKIVQDFGNVHVLVNNAGVAVGGPLDTMTFDDWKWLMDVNVYGVIHGLLSFLPHMRDHGEGGHVVNTASMAGHLAIPGLGVYNATKWAVVGISETLRADVAAHDIGVSVLCPGVVNTNIFTSERNRPNQSKSGESDLVATEAQLEQVRGGALDPAVVGEAVLHAIQTNQAYIFTHPEFKAAVEDRFRGVEAAFDDWQSHLAK